MMNNEVLPVSDQRATHDHDQISSLVWAMVLIWAGLVFFAENFGVLERLSLTARGGLADLFHLGAWSLIFIGAGALVLVGVVVRLLLPEQRGSLGGQIVLAAVLFGIGLNNLVGWRVLWPLMIIAIGISVLLGAITRRR